MSCAIKTALKVAAGAAAATAGAIGEQCSIGVAHGVQLGKSCGSNRHSVDDTWLVEEICNGACRAGRVLRDAVCSGAKSAGRAVCSGVKSAGKFGRWVHRNGPRSVIRRRTEQLQEAKEERVRQEQLEEAERVKEEQQLERERNIAAAQQTMREQKAKQEARREALANRTPLVAMCGDQVRGVRPEAISKHNGVDKPGVRNERGWIDSFAIDGTQLNKK